MSTYHKPSPKPRSPIADDTILIPTEWETPTADEAAKALTVDVEVELDLLTYILLTATCCVLGAEQRGALLHKAGVSMAAAKRREVRWLELAEVVAHLPLIELMTCPPQEVVDAATALLKPTKGASHGSHA